MTDYRIAAAYIRVSTDEQTELSPASQLVEIRKWGAQNGYIVPDEYVFVDEAKSGKKTTGRDNFRRLIATAKSKPKPFEAILLWKFSRFARNRDDAVYFKSILRKQLKIEVLSIKEPIEEGKMGVIMEAMIEAMDEYYSLNLAEDVKRGMEENHRRGNWQSSPPFGYRVEDHRLVIEDSEAVYVQELFRRYLQGDGFFPLAKYLNDMGCRTHRGSPFENRTVEYILRNPVYTGMIRWNPAGRTRRDYDNPNIVLVPGTHPPLITREEFDAVQIRIAQQKAITPYRSKPLKKNTDWLSGIVRCASCGSTLIFSAPHYWKCNNFVRGRCRTSQHISAELLKDAILRRLQADASTAEDISFEILRPGRREDDVLSGLHQQRAAAQRRFDRLREAYLAGVETLEEYKAAKEETARLIQQLDASIAEAASDARSRADKDALRAAVRHTLSTLLDEEASTEAKSTAIRSIAERIVWDKAQNTLTIHYRLVLD